MFSNNVTARHATQLGAGLLLLLALPAQAIEYDGNWQFTLSCSAQGTQTAFTDRFTAPIAQNAFTRSRSTRTDAGLDDSSRFSGRVTANQMAATLERTRGNERWTIRLAGPATSDRRFDLPGGLFVGERQLRSCQLVAEALTSAPGSLAATAPVRAAAAQQQLAESSAQLAAATAALAALQASSEARGDVLQTELDLARFEGAAMRNELTLRTAALVVLTGRVQAAEAANTQAQAGLAAAAAEIGQRDQRLAAATAATTQAEAAATAQRNALEARAAAAGQVSTQAQAALARSEAAAAGQRSALEARVTAAEQANAQAQAALARAETAAAGQRSGLEARVTAAEQAGAQAQASLVQLRASLATAQRELAEARAAQPPR